MIIKSKYDAELFLKELEKSEEEYCIYDDVDICMLSGGNTTLYLEGYGDDIEYYTYSSGPNWWDQERTQLSRKKVIEKIWRNRKNINAETRRCYF